MTARLGLAGLLDPVATLGFQIRRINPICLSAYVWWCFRRFSEDPSFEIFWSFFQHLGSRSHAGFVPTCADYQEQHNDIA